MKTKESRQPLFGKIAWLWMNRMIICPYFQRNIIAERAEAHEHRFIDWCSHGGQSTLSDLRISVNGPEEVHGLASVRKDDGSGARPKLLVSNHCRNAVLSPSPSLASRSQGRSRKPIRRLLNLLFILASEPADQQGGNHQSCRLWIGSLVRDSSPQLHSWNSDFVVSCSRSPSRKPTLLVPRWYLVHRLHFRWNGNTKAALPRRLRNRSALPYVPHPQNSDRGDLARSYFAAGLQGNIPMLEPRQSLEASKTHRLGWYGPARQDSHLRSSIPHLGKGYDRAQVLRIHRSTLHLTFLIS